MGTDITLSWNDMTEDEKEQQRKAKEDYLINKGELGYLRASINMHEENKLLFLFFPEKYWRYDRAYLYDFEANLERLNDLLDAYVEGIKISLDNPVTETNKKILEHIRQFKDDIIIKDVLDYEGRNKYAESFHKFFILGVTKQRLDKKPKVRIEW